MDHDNVACAMRTMTTPPGKQLLACAQSIGPDVAMMARHTVNDLIVIDRAHGARYACFSLGAAYRF